MTLPRTVGDRCANELFHARQLVGGRRPVVAAHDDVANCPESNHRRDVHRRLESVERGPKLREGRELAARVILFSIARRSRRARRSVLSDDDRRDALTHERLGARIAPEASVAVRVNVDESGRDRATARIDLDRALVARSAGDGNNSAGGDYDIELLARSSSSVEDGSVSDDDVRRSARAKEQGRRGENGGGARRCAKKIASRSHP